MDTSAAMGAVREKVADQLSLASPDPIAKDDLRFVPASLTTDDVLGDVRLLVTQGGSVRSLAEHSDGTRALYAMALYDLVSASSSIVAIDEPEIHLHPASQRSLARILQAGSNQKIIATQSSDIVGAFDPECVVTVKRGGVVVQPAAGFLSADQRMMMRWWVRDRLEPLTATRIIAVEGTADRIIVQLAAELTRRVLDRHGVSVLESGGAGDMGPIHTMFGPTGFQIPLSVLIDADAEQATATKLGIQVADLTAHSVWVSRPDLEGEYVAALGAAAVWTAIQTSGLFTSNELGNCAATGPAGTRTDDDVAAFCRRNSNYKVRAAIAVASALTEPTARKITSIESLLVNATRV
jgi:putative ATP-dependent endonuclease of OLD family